ncbi:hypothetical protein [Serratia inhibens]|uniref:hypothetical protein n=1 Tax=Serratia inhibens TaxID=2338073 RepID=UPI00025E3706|nr:hypothetical protein [Serratia inhibens]ANS42370.1 hypothetical protein Q5A_009540 [Serratia inhibens PRI-2C]
MRIKLDMKSNAIDSFNEALAKLESAQTGDLKSYKFTILHLSHAIELVLKMYLQTLDENLVFSKCYKKVKQRASEKKIDLLAAFYELEDDGFDFRAVIAGHDNPLTVNVSDVLAIAKNEKCGTTGNNFVDQEFIDDIDWMKGVRNAIEHFQFEFTVKEVRLCIGRLVRGLDEFSDIFSLFDLEKEVGKHCYETFQVLADEYEHSLAEAHMDVREAKDALFKGTRPKHQMFIEWNEYYCEECNNETLIPNDDSKTGYKCTFCGNEESGKIEVDCDVCGLLWANEEMSNWGENLAHVCPRCVNPEKW